MRRLEIIKDIAFPNERSNGKFPGLNNRGRKPNRKKLPPLERMEQDDKNRHFNTFYQAPIGEENFQIKHIVLQPSEPKPEEEVVELVIEKKSSQDVRPQTEAHHSSYQRPQTSDMQAELIKDDRFERKVLFNHERTQRKLSTSSKYANQE